MAAEAAGFALTAVGLLFALKGAVDGYVLIDAIIEKDNGSRYLALRYEAEKRKLELWGENFNVDDEVNCTLKQQSAKTRALLANILAEMNATHESAAKYVKRYGMEPITEQAGTGVTAQTFHKSSDWVSNLVTSRSAKKHKNRTRWGAKDKQKFSALVDRLETLNKDLYEVVKLEAPDPLRMASAILSGIDDKFSLIALQHQPPGQAPTLLALSARLKQLQVEPDTDSAKEAPRLTSSELTFHGDPDATDGRILGFYEPANSNLQRIWAEWKTVEVTQPDREQIILRIQALAHFYVPLVPPPNENSLVSLSELVSEARTTHERPALGDRFQLAYALASSMCLLHASKWLHKSFRSDNIIFPSKYNIKEPYISGFEYSRPTGTASLETRPVGDPKLDLYYHPDVVNGWTKIKDIYSLGVVLLEIALWRPVYEDRLKSLSLQEVSEVLKQEVTGKAGEMKDGLVGKVFMDVVRSCLTGNFGVVSGESQGESQVLAKSFFLKVVKQLEYCKA